MKKGWDLCDFLNRSTRFYQKRNGFRFGTDTFLLADFVKIKGGEYVADLGCGCGVIGILLLKKYKNIKVLALDVLEENVALTLENAKLNGVEDRIEVVYANVRDVKEILKGGSFDVVVTNPPFIEKGRGDVSLNFHRAVARQEILGGLEDFVEGGSFLLKNRGRFYMVLPVGRLWGGSLAMKMANIEPKRLRFIHPDFKSPANLFLVEGIKGGREGLEVEPPLVVYEDVKKRVYTEEVDKKYKEFLWEGS